VIWNAAVKTTLRFN